MGKDKGKHRSGHGRGTRHGGETAPTPGHDAAPTPDQARTADPPSAGESAQAAGGESAKAAGGEPALPGTRAELMALHAATRRRRNSAELGSAEHRAAVELIGRIEVEIARIERAADPPLV